MRAFLLAAVVGLLSLPGFAPSPAVPAERDLNFTVYNQSGYTITAIYGSWCGRPGVEGGNMLGQSVLYAGQEFTAAIPPGCANFRAVASSGHQFYHGQVVRADGVYEWIVYS